jgi:membrane protease YdiL (CAAX protease family)
MTRAARVPGGTEWSRLLLGLALVFALFHGVATVTGSDRGQAGLLVGALVVAATLAVERLLFGEPLAKAARDVGLGRPRARGLVAAGGVCALLMLVFPIVSAIESARPAVDPRWSALLPGLFAQAGIAEEILFRGYLFRRVRVGRSFWHAVALAALPFAAVHLILFATMPWPIALAAVLLSVIVGAPFAYLFELGGGTIWAPALAHFTIQGAIKLVSLEPADPRLPVVWMAASAVVPFLVFLVPRR